MSHGHGGSATRKPPPDFTRDFQEVHRAELERIRLWREKTRRPALREWPEGASAPIETTGVAISGGGIRSAAFALGALQALNQDLSDQGDGRGGLERIDYLSTVSGGGYVGASVSVGMDALGGVFPFSPGDNDKTDNPAVGHIRNHSRYLIPGGFPDVIGCLAVVLRGLVVNLVFVVSVLLILAGLTGVFNPDQSAFRTPDLLGLEGFPFPQLINALGAFAYTKLLLLIGVVLYFAWALSRSRLNADAREFCGPPYWVAWTWVLVTAGSAVLELQPFAIAGLFYDTSRSLAGVGLIATITAWMSTATTYLAPFAAAAAVFNKMLGDTLKTARTDPRRATWVRAAMARATLIIMVLTLPMVIWISYLELTLLTDLSYLHRPDWINQAVYVLCGTPDIGPNSTTGNGGICHSKRVFAWLFVFAGLALFGLTLLLKPNANSLHRLYRDRLSKAFLFDPRDAHDRLAERSPCDPTPLAKRRFAELNPENGPLHLINAALNVQGSKVVNRRGRNADFFFMSPAYIGSNSTGFVRTAADQSVVEIPDIGTAMAVSGAAASSNMGGNTVRGLSPTLALLNIRLGFWMTNPALLDPKFLTSRTLWEKVKAAGAFYLTEEMFNVLDERSASIYLTDGGHIENLGLYELLRRRCRLILVIDAEADPAMTFTSLVQAQRFARIDLGVRIDLPWQAIRDASLAIDAAVAEGKPIKLPPVDTPSAEGAPEPQRRPHIAIGRIEYKDGEGMLIYAKASLTGDENDYVLDYKLRHPTFPHESTGDQFFSEEQFEVYRALGFHVLHGALKGKTHVEGLEGSPSFTIFGSNVTPTNAKAKVLSSLFS